MKEIPLIAAIATLVFVLGLIIGEYYAHEKIWAQCRETGTTTLTHGRALSCAPVSVKPTKEFP